MLLNQKHVITGMEYALAQRIAWIIKRKNMKRYKVRIPLVQIQSSILWNKRDTNRVNCGKVFENKQA